MVSIARLHDILPTSWLAVENDVTVGCASLRDLASTYDTPLYVYDKATIRATSRAVRSWFAPLNARTSFAAKACETLGVLRVFREEGLDLDVVSAGEIEAALRAGFRPSQLHLHGNAKSDAELELAVSLGIHAVVIDNVVEARRLQSIAERQSLTVRVMIRLRLGLEAETHPHLQTGGAYSKFGISETQLPEIASIARDSENLKLVGIHVHVGSQIHDITIYRRAAEELTAIAGTLHSDGFPIEEASVGGGWRVAYRPGETTIGPEEVAEAIAPSFQHVPWLRPAVEPGRALVARAGIALYRIVTVKDTPTGRLIAVDGGMGDNPRPALYDARYHALAIGKDAESSAGSASIVGRYCEAGDVLARDVELPSVSAGDLICIHVAGAYQLSMASAYNLVPPPAVVMVGDGEPRLLTRRATIEDLLAREVGQHSAIRGKSRGRPGRGVKHA